MIQCHHDLVIASLFTSFMQMSFRTHPEALGLFCGLCLTELKEGKWVSDGEPWLVIIPYGTELCKQLLLAEQHVPLA